jgi:hypothetical protein
MQSRHRLTVTLLLNLTDAVEKGKFGKSQKNCSAMEEILSRAAGGPAESTTNSPAITRIEQGSSFSKIAQSFIRRSFWLDGVFDFLTTSTEAV